MWCAKCTFNPDTLVALVLPKLLRVNLRHQHSLNKRLTMLKQKVDKTSHKVYLRKSQFLFEEWWCRRLTKWRKWLTKWCRWLTKRHLCWRKGWQNAKSMVVIDALSTIHVTLSTIDISIPQVNGWQRVGRVWTRLTIVNSLSPKQKVDNDVLSTICVNLSTIDVSIC